MRSAKASNAAEASQARLLTCGEVRVELSEAAEGLRKVSAPVRRHVRECDECADFRRDSSAGAIRDERGDDRQVVGRLPKFDGRAILVGL